MWLYLLVRQSFEHREMMQEKLNEKLQLQIQLEQVAKEHFLCMKS